MWGASEMYANMRRTLLAITVINLLFLLSCASTPPPQLNPNELRMLAEIQRERGERNAQIASRFLQKTKLIRERAGNQYALEYLMRIGVHYPYEAMKIRETVFGDQGPTEFDRELRMLAEIQRERGERNAQLASQFLQQTKLIRKKAGRQNALEYLMEIGTRYPYEAMKIHETVFGDQGSPEFDRELRMLAEIQKKRGERNAQLAQQVLQKVKLIQMKAGRQKALEYLMRIGTRYPYEANKIRETVFGDQAVAHADRPPERITVSSDEHITVPDKTRIPPRPRFRKKFALAIGISNYKNHGKTGLTNLLFADDDALDFSEALLKLGWRSSQIKTLINKRATKRNIEIALESWFTKAGQDDLIVLFWSGHGFHDPEDPEKVYFACYDSETSIPATGYRMDRVRQSLEERGARNVLFFADTCHAGKLITRGDKGISVVPHLQKLRREKKIPKGWIFMVGAETDRLAVENSSWSNGAFTHCLIEGLLGKADGFESTGSDDGIITMGELQAYLNTAMPDETQKVLGVAKRPLITTTTGDPSIWDLSLTD